MRFIFNSFVVLFFSATTLWAESAVPERRLTLTRDLDFYGSDLQNIFDTTLEACQRICLTNKDCSAFTFNTRSNACFPKSTVTEAQPYEGAVSGRVLRTDTTVLATAATRQASLGFLNENYLAAARSLARELAGLHVTGEWTAKAHLNAARTRAAAGETKNALWFTGAALNLTDAPDQWAEYARFALQLATEDRDQSYTYNARAVSASVNSYLRASTTAEQVSALTVLAQALERQNRGRDMIPALRLAQATQPRDETQAALEDAIGKYGFRITEHTVDSDAATPRICAVFSKDLVQAGLDYSPYVQLPETGMTVEQNGQQICIEGVEHGSRYRVQFREGLPAASGEALNKSVELNLYVRDRSPAVRFSGRAYVLPKSGEAALPIESVNVDTVDLTLSRVSDRNLLRAIQDNYFGRPMNYWQEQNFSSDIAEQIWQGTGSVEMMLNQDMTTRLPMGDVIGDLPAGIYTLRAAVPGSDSDTPTATQWFVLSDLGIATLSGADGLHVFVRSLGSAAPKEGTAVTLLSRANAVLAETMTDARGYAHFANGLTSGRGASSPALVTVADGETDIAFLSLTDPGFDLSDRGVEGRAPAGAIDAFVTTDRGAYRAGETVHATALARDGKAEALSGLPLTAVLTRPDGVEYSRETSTETQAGGHVFDLPIIPSAPRGTWRLALYADPDAPALTRTSFLVEDFLPERIDFTLALPDTPLRLSDQPALTVDARYLFGTPGAELPVEGEVLVRATNGLPDFPGYVFGRYDQRFEPQTDVLPFGQRTDAAGRAVLPVTFPQFEGVIDRPLEARLTVRVAEGSGRPVERELTQRLASASPMIGIKPLFDGVVAEGSDARFNVIAIDETETPTAMRVRWSVNRVETRYQWYRLYGNWNWEPTVTRSRVASGEVDLDGTPLEISAPVEWGRYEVKVERLGSDYTASSTDFYAGWYAPADASATPDTLAVSLDKPAYASGETATLRVVPRYAGKALITVVSNRLIDMQTVEVSEGENLIPLTVTDDWGAGAYVTATVIRPMDVAAGHNPARALGLSYAPVDPGLHKLTASFNVPAESAPRSTLDVALTVDGISPGETAYATIAAVDVGILNLTAFESPDPSDHYFGQRKLGMGMRDLYGRLIDGMNGAMGTVRSGGDAGAQGRLQSPPPTEELVAYFSGPVTVGADGVVRTSFDMPSFNGTVRLMAVVWSDTGVGQSEADVLVRDPVVVTASLPRFLSPGDETRMLLEVVHATGPSGRVGLDVTADGVTLGTLPSGFDIGDQGKFSVSVPVTAGDVGLQTINIALTTPDGRQLSKIVTVPVQIGDPEVARTSRFTLAAGNSFSFDADVFAGLRSGTGTATLSVGPLARFDVPGLLQALDRYPYGCTEQVTSRALPLLYFDQVAEAMGLATRDQVALRIDQAIAEVLTNQSSNGAFGLWRADTGDFWLDAYVTDFLGRARTQGFTVPEPAFRQALNNLRNQVNYTPDFDEGGQEIAYALFILAREGAAATGDLRYYADVKGDAFSTPLAAAQLGAALASYGDQTRADAMFARAARLMASRMGDETEQLWRTDYGTNLRDAAAVLTLAVEAGTEVIDRATLADRIAPLRGSRNRSTQEAMWTLMAANALIQSPEMQGFTVNGEAVDGPLVKVLESQTEAGTLEIRNGSESEATVTVTTFGIPSEPEPAGGNGYAIERLYYTLDGIEVSPDGVPVGTRLVTVLRVSPFAKIEARLMVNDPLPAGFEIDNPNLMRGGDISALEWLELHEDVENAEFRQDRFLAAVDWRSDKPFRLAYIVRAISPGSFHHPAASVEDMYRPAFRARTAAGQIKVVE